MSSIYAIVTLIIIGIAVYMALPIDDTDKSRWNRSGMSLHTDNKTGLQYLGKYNALTPRLDQMGNHMHKDHK